MNRESVLRSYRLYARIYPLVFGIWLEPGRRVTLGVLDCRPGERVLEIGVGTGWALRRYPRSIELHGIDLSPEMLERAKARSVKLGLDPSRLQVMDAQKMDFPDAHFDKCVAMYVASVAPDPQAMVAEMRRVTKPGGTICLVNHFSRRGSWMAWAEGILAPWAAFIGFEPLFYLDDFMAAAGLHGAKEHPVFPFGYWRVLLLTI